MDISALDSNFPYLVFVYGLVMILITDNPWIAKLAEKRLPEEIWANLQRKKYFGYVMLFVGGLWSIQNLWLGN